jgi:hypothetical protein
MRWREKDRDIRLTMVIRFGGSSRGGDCVVVQTERMGNAIVWMNNREEEVIFGTPNKF